MVISEALAVVSSGTLRNERMASPSVAMGVKEDLVRMTAMVMTSTMFKSATMASIWALTLTAHWSCVLWVKKITAL